MTPTQQALRSRPTARHSLGLTATQVTVIFGLGMVGLGLAIKLLAPQLWRGPATGPLLALGCLLVPLAGAILLSQGLARARIAWLDQLDLPLDRESYLDALDRSRDRGRLAIIVTPEPGVRLSPPEVSTLPGTTAELVEGALHLVSPAVSVAAFSRAASHGVHAGKLHRWFQRCADDVLRPLATRTRLAEVRAEFRPA
jgi:hypothetical protein